MHTVRNLTFTAALIAAGAVFAPVLAQEEQQEPGAGMMGDDMTENAMMEGMPMMAMMEQMSRMMENCNKMMQASLEPEGSGSAPAQPQERQ